jgi:hypothetical protein
MTATRPRRHGKRAFLALLAGLPVMALGSGADPGWRLVVIPSFERPALHQSIPRSQTALIAAARDDGHGLFGYATTRGAMRWARDLGKKEGENWLNSADIKIRRGKDKVIDRILITGSDPLHSSLTLTPAFYRRFEPLLGEGFHVVIPDRNTIALYPRLGGEIPPVEAALLLRINALATYPVSREVFRATSSGLVADGILTEG